MWRTDSAAESKGHRSTVTQGSNPPSLQHYLYCGGKGSSRPASREKREKLNNLCGRKEHARKSLGPVAAMKTRGITISCSYESRQCTFSEYSLSVVYNEASMRDNGPFLLGTHMYLSDPFECQSTLKFTKMPCPILNLCIEYDHYDRLRRISGRIDDVKVLSNYHKVYSSSCCGVSSTSGFAMVEVGKLCSPLKRCKFAVPTHHALLYNHRFCLETIQPTTSYCNFFPAPKLSQAVPSCPRPKRRTRILYDT